MSPGKLALPVEARDFASKVKELDLGPIAYKLMNPDEGNGWSREKTTGAIARYLMFLCLIYLYPNRPIIPTPEIDAVWHQHILDTSKYAEDCERLFGRFIHHFPYFGQRGESDRENLAIAFAETQALFQEHFGAGALAEAHTAAEENKLLQPAGCEPPKHSTQYRPRVDIDIAEVWEVLA
ncbi:MAG: glycine-rich domain-containing protein-like [Oscillatoria sp. SIO1A7]|nr:glycine-rich domain-containing protein-like [Oscillatoria sp. SIO1A7]